MSDTPNLSLPLIQPAQAQKHVTHNQAIAVLDALVQLVVDDLYATAPPADPADGLVLGIGGQAQGAFNGRDGQLAVRSNGGWLYLTPREGMRAWNRFSGALHVRQGNAWPKLETGGTGGTGGAPAGGDGAFDTLGVNATADATNRLSVAAPATLLNNAGGGHQLKINKATAGDTASLLFQSGFSGRAEMGLAGTGDFSIKVSADGAAWFTALGIDGASGAISAASLAGDAVQQAADDTTPGRLMRADYGYGPGNAVGPVAESGGQPTGAIVETGTTADGDYTRFADGTQICRALAAVDRDVAAGTGDSATVTFPRPFVAGSAVVTPSLDTGDAGIVRAIGLGAVSGGAADTTLAFDNASAATVRVVIGYVAHGRWF